MHALDFLIAGPFDSRLCRKIMAESSLAEAGKTPLSSSQATTIPELIENFDALGDWEAQCDYLIDLGDELPEFPASARTEANRVHGCQSNVWLVADSNRRRSAQH